MEAKNGDARLMSHQPARTYITVIRCKKCNDNERYVKSKKCVKCCKAAWVINGENFRARNDS